MCATEIIFREPKTYYKQENLSYPEDDNLIMARRLIDEETRQINEIQNYGSINNTDETYTCLQDFLTSIWTSFTIKLAATPLALLMISALYFDINTSNICFIHHEQTLPRRVMKWILTGHIMEVLILHFWYQIFLILTFTWREIMSRHRYTLFIAFLQGVTVSIYKVILFTQHVNFTLDSYRYTGNVVFLLGVIYTGYIVSKKICYLKPADGFTKRRVFKILTTQYFVGSIIVMLFRYLAIPWFISEENEITKGLIAVTVHLSVITLNIINKQDALRSSKFVKPGRNFVVMSFTTGVNILVFRIMQADVKNINIFIALSIYRGLVQILLTATEKLRERILNAICRYFKICCRCSQTENEGNERSDSVRLDVDNYIQLMLYQHSALIVSQAYQVFYILNNYYAKPWEVIAESLMRVGIGCAINFVSNSASIFIYVYWYNSRLPAIWYQEWKLHMTTVAIGGVMTIIYFTVVLLSVFQHSEQDLVIRNCTVLF